MTERGVESFLKCKISDPFEMMKHIPKSNATYRIHFIEVESEELLPI